MKIIIGAGIYGLYAALYLCQRTKDKIIVLEYDSYAFKRATYINQARVHMGYHYPRSLSTAVKSAHYFNRFVNDFGFCIHDSFEQIYATSTDFSWTDASEFFKFCKDANILCERVDKNKYFKNDMCDGAFITQEYTYDAMLLRDYFLKELSRFDNVEIIYDVRILSVEANNNDYIINTNKGTLQSSFVLNATYGSTNQIISMFHAETFKIKYELCEIILCEPGDHLKGVGITVMDGPFFSIMPFGKTGYHSLTSVTFTPHCACYEELPVFECMNGNEEYCTSYQFGNCNDCFRHPESSWHYMSTLAKKYIKDEYDFSYNKSLFSIKPILLASEVDDSRPTVIRIHNEGPTFVSVLSGKINTVYDLDVVLDEVIKNG